MHDVYIRLVQIEYTILILELSPNSPAISITPSKHRSSQVRATLRSKNRIGMLVFGVNDSALPTLADIGFHPVPQCWDRIQQGLCAPGYDERWGKSGELTCTPIRVTSRHKEVGDK
jgi:hypothetical protein